MSEQLKKILKIIGLVIFGIGIVVGIILILVGDNLFNNWGTITSTISAALEVSIAITFNLDVKINKTVNSSVTKIKNDFDIEIKTYRQQINVLKKTVSNNVNNVSVNYGTQKDKNEEQIKKISTIYEPIERFVTEVGNFDSAMDPTPFDDLCEFTKIQFNTPYMMTGQLGDIYFDLCVLANKFNSLYEFAIVVTQNPPYVMSRFIKMDKDSRHKIKNYSKDELISAKENYNETWKTLVEITNKFQDLIREYRKSIL